LFTFLDAKYRDLWATKLPREMLYQLALYAIAQGHGAAAMLYPTDAEDAVEERLDICNPASGVAQASVALRPVHLSRLRMLIEASRTNERSRQRESFAHSLITALT
jgi:5-methylcytosine-specific restriction enzyme subunit McrC